MDQASASSAASCARNPVAPRTSSSCSRSADRSQTGVPLPARSGPQSEPHAEPSNRDPSPSSPPSANSRLRAISCRSFTPAQPHNPAASLRDYCSGAYRPAMAECDKPFLFGSKPFQRQTDIAGNPVGEFDDLGLQLVAAGLQVPLPKSVKLGRPYRQRKETARSGAD